MATYMQQISHYPAGGKGPELRAVLEEWVTTAPSRGVAHNLVSQFGSEGPVFIVGIRHENLAAFQTFRERNRANPAFGPFIAKLQSLMARPSRFALYQGLIPPSSQAPTPSFQFRVSRYPAIGKAQRYGRFLRSGPRRSRRTCSAPSDSKCLAARDRSS